MQVKLKSGKTFDMSEEQIRQLVNMYSAWVQTKFDAEKLQHYFQDMWKKAHMNLQMIADETIDTEKDTKDALCMVMKYGTTSDVADFIIEAIEAKVSYMILESMR